jgi:hypothetical protein
MARTKPSGLFKRSHKPNNSMVFLLRIQFLIISLGAFGFLFFEFQRLKEVENKSLDWDIKRNLSKINYRIHTDVIKQNLVPKALTKQQTAFISILIKHPI